MTSPSLPLPTPPLQWGRVPALNTNQAFIDDLADAVIEALPYVGQLVGPAAEKSLVPIGEDEGGERRRGRFRTSGQLVGPVVQYS